MTTAQKNKYLSYARMIGECEASGMKKCDWCREHNISYRTYKYRRKRIRELGIEPITPGNSSVFVDDKNAIKHIKDETGRIIINNLNIYITNGVDCNGK